ncbi:MAG TPA: choice-of-anchor D domain-containing protein [Verrucomicrobiae bacterium]|nr:choice-of-anchor D domain-containing protein [Verrucomicrobiae bacterium]
MRGGICLFALVLSISVVHAQNAIQIENTKQGDASWQATNLADAQPPNYTDQIEGYASFTSVNRGGQITFYVNVSTPGDSFTMNIYRMGWYGGLGARKVLSVGPLPGVQQPTCPTDATTGLIECNWAASYTLPLNSSTDPVSDWVSGVYIALLTDISSGPTNGLQRYIVFVVRDDASTSKYFFQCAVDTYQAYNNWGGKSLYAFDSANNSPATKVSFNRPYKKSYGYDGSGDFLTGWEYDTVRFLEREGYDVTYGTDLDAHENPNLLLSHQAILIVGHSEYWSSAMRTNIIAARDNKVSLGIFAADVCYWQVRFEPSVVNPSAADRTMVGYKDFATSFTAPGPDPYYAACTGTGVPLDTTKCPLVTVQWRQPPVNMPENAFVGVMFQDSPVDGDIVVPDVSNWVFNTTGLQNNGTLPGLLGYEVDSLFNNGLTPAGTVTLGASPYTTTGTPPASGASNMTVYTAASGATVFAAGSIQFGWGLDDYSRMLCCQSSRVSFAAQQMTRNLLANFIGDQPPVANPGGPYTGTALQSIQFSGTGSSDPDGTIATYQWDFGDGTTGTGSNPTHTYAVAGTYTVTLIVTDSQGSRNAATTTAAISGQPVAALSSLTLSFGNQLVGTTSAAKGVRLSNTGTAPLTIASMVATGDFAQTNNCAGSVAAGASCTITVTFTPTATGSRSGAITITDNNNGVNGSTQTVTLSGTGTAPVAGVLPASLGFGNQLLGTPSASMTTTLSNTGTAALTIASMVATGDFAQTNNCAGSVAAGASCTITVAFTPTATGSRSGAITITDNNNGVNGSTQTVTLSGMGTAPVAGVLPASLGFGNQLLGTTSAAQTVTLTNSGTATLTITSIAASGDFSQTNNCGTSVATSANCTISLTFTPTLTDARNGTLTITDNASGSPQMITLSGMGVAFGAGVSVSSLTFGSQVVGMPSAAQTVTVTNTGTALLNFSSIAASGDFSVATSGTTCSSTTPLAVGASCVIAVTFTPTAIGTRTGSLTLTDDAVTQAVALSGTGTTPGASLSPSSLTFGSQVMGAIGSAQTATLTNTGTSGLDVTGISSSGDFAQANTCGTLPAVLAPSASCAISVTFTPTATGARTGSLTVTDDASGGSQSVALSGTGTTPGVTLTPSTLTFSTQPVGSAGASQNVVLANSGTSNLNVTAISISGDFSQANSCGTLPAVVAPRGTCTFSVQFTPTAVGARTGTITITDDAGSSPQTVSLNGIGAVPRPAIAPASLTFAAQAIGAASPPQPVTLTNSSSVSLAVISTSITGANAVDFATSADTCSGTTVAPGGNCSVSVAFTPSAIGARSATLSFADNAPGSPQIVPLSGTGTDPILSLSPTTILTFSSQLMGTSSAAQTVTLTNSGNATLYITSISVSGDFAEANTCGASVTAGASCAINVTFTPTAIGSRAGTLTINDNASGSPQAVALAGSGTGPVVGLSPSSLSFSSAQVVGITSAAQTVTLSNTGNALLSITSVATSGDFAETNTCASSVVAGANCTISVTFMPMAAGSRTGTLTITDNASNSPQTVALSGTGEDFGVAVTSGTSATATVTAGASTTYTIAASPLGGFNQAITMSCTGAPSLAACSVSPASVTLDGTNSATVMVNVTTTAPTLAPPASNQRPLPPRAWPLGGWLALLGLLLATVTAVGACPDARRGCRFVAQASSACRRATLQSTMRHRGYSTAWRLALLASLLTLLGSWASCGGGGGGVIHAPGTPAGTYTLTVTATSGSLTHNIHLSLNVN